MKKSRLQMIMSSAAALATFTLPRQANSEARVPTVALAASSNDSDGVKSTQVRKRALQNALGRKAGLAYEAARSGLLFGTMWGAGIGSGGDHERSDYIQAVERDCSLSVGWGLNGFIKQAGFDFGFGDRQIALAKAQGMASGGGYLIVGGDVPNWIDITQATPLAREVFKNAITSPLARYSDHMDHWIVVNEAINVKHGLPKGYARSGWLSAIGDDYIQQAFAIARNSDPSAILIYNDNSFEEESSFCDKQRQAILDLLASLKSNGLVDGLGMQSHLGLWRKFDGDRFSNFLDAVSAMGLGLYVTELDVNDKIAPADISTRDALVAEKYEAYISTILKHQALRSINVWGLSDNHSWLQKFTPRADGVPLRPCLLDSKLGKKAAYETVYRCLEEHAKRNADRRA